MISEIILPALGETMDEATLLRWLKEPGEPVRKGDPLFEIETDKATIEVEAATEGVLRAQQAEAGQVIPIGTIVGYVADSMEAPLPEMQEEVGDGTGQRPLSPPPSRSKEPAVRERPPRQVERVFASPRARRLADEEGIDIQLVEEGTGPKGRIVEADVRRYLQERAATPETITGDGRRGQVVPLEGAHKAMADRMVRSAREAPQFHLTATVDMSLVEQSRRKLNQREAGTDRVKVTATAYVVMAAAWALRRHPYANASLQDDEIHLHDDVHIGVAVARESGLIVPVLRHADRKSLQEIAEEIGELAARARQGTLTAGQAAGSTFTVSNLGMFGIDQFSAIINPPESAILAVGQVENKVHANDAGEVSVRPQAQLTLTCDHRVLDGATGARFLQELTAALENPVLMIQPQG